MEIERDDVVFRMVEGTAAIAYPDLLLVEHGNWGEAVRQLADVWLPWMPYRSNRELARWFHVERLDWKDEKHPDLVFLRFRPHGGPKSGDTYMEVAFSNRDGLAHVWDFYQKGIQTGRLRFVGDSGVINKVILEDRTERQIAHWELTAWEPRSVAIPDLIEGWEGYLQLDQRSERPAVDRTFAQALEAMHRFEWDRAFSSLVQAKADHPQHPLLELLTAWCCEQQPSFASSDELQAMLRQVVTGPAPGLVRFIDQANFPSLEPGQLFDVLNQQPEATRDVVDLDRLGRCGDGCGSAASSPGAQRSGPGVGSF